MKSTDRPALEWGKKGYEYDGKPQKIIPITILQLEKILQTIKEIFESKNTFKHETLQKLYEDCTNISSINSSALWLEHINTKINTWIEK